MKKILCIILSALLIGAFCVFSVSADSGSFYSYSGDIVAGQNVSTVLDFSSASLPFHLDSSSPNLISVISQPSYSVLDSLDLSWTGGASYANVNTSLYYYLSNGVLISAGSRSDGFAEGLVFHHVYDLSSLPSGIVGYVVEYSLVNSSHNFSVNNVVYDLDFTSNSAWNGIGSFITGLFGAIGSIVTGIIGQPVILAFVILLPLTAIGLGYLFRFLGKKRKGK